MRPPGPPRATRRMRARRPPDPMSGASWARPTLPPRGCPAHDPKLSAGHDRWDLPRNRAPPPGHLRIAGNTPETWQDITRPVCQRADPWHVVALVGWVCTAPKSTSSQPDRAEGVRTQKQKAATLQDDTARHSR